VVTKLALLNWELNLSLTEGELERAFRDCGVETSGAGECQKERIKVFYDARKDRRIKKEGCTPSDNCNTAP
jgi:hypothetical protein